MKFKELFENTGNIIKLSDLYDEDDLNNPYEMMTHFISDEDLENQFEVKIMTPEMGKSLTTTGGFTRFNSI